MKQRQCPHCKSELVVYSYLEWLPNSRGISDLLAEPKTKVWECLDCGGVFSDRHPELAGFDLPLSKVAESITK